MEPMARLRHAWTILVVSACVQGAVGLQRAAEDLETERLRMVEEQLRGRDIREPRVLDAMRKVPRHLFVPESVVRVPTTIRLCRSNTTRPSRNPTSSRS